MPSWPRRSVSLNAAGGAGDAQPDTVIVNGTGGNDHFDVGSAAGRLVASGLAVEVQVGGAEAATDTLRVDGGDGADTVQYTGTDGADSIDVAAKRHRREHCEDRDVAHRHDCRREPGRARARR